MNVAVSWVLRLATVFAGILSTRDLGRCVDAEDADVHAEDFMTLHRFVDVERHGAEILADDLRAVGDGIPDSISRNIPRRDGVRTGRRRR